MNLVTFDTSVLIPYKPEFPRSGFVLSAVVLQEMTTGSADDGECRWWGQVRFLFEKENRLLVPSGEDWFEAGKILNALLRGKKSKSKGRTPKHHPDDKQRIIRDVLIARTAKRAGVTVVTDNLKDFEEIKRFCKVKVISGREYFKKS